MRKLSLTALTVGLLLPTQAWAQVTTSWTGVLCGIVPCTSLGGGAAGLSAYLITRVAVVIQFGFIAAAVLALFFAAANMVMFAEQEDVVKQGKMTFIHAIAAAAVVSLAELIQQAFTPVRAGGGNIVNLDPIELAVGNILLFAKGVLTVMLVANIVIQGFRLINSRGEQDQFEKARKRLIAGFIGVAFVLLAQAVPRAINPSEHGAHRFTNEIVGFANYLGTIVGFIAVVAIIVAGFLLILSVNEGLKDKAKNLIKVSLIVLVAVVASYALITFFVVG